MSIIHYSSPPLSRSLNSLPLRAPFTTAHAARDTVAAARGILLDWDGCVAMDNRPLPDAVRFIAQRLERVAIVSNNSTDTPADLARILAMAGVALPAERIILAGTEALAQAAQERPSAVLVIGDPRIKAHARRLGLPLSDGKPDVVVLLRDPRFTYAKLQRAANALRSGARLLVANPDLTHPLPGGRVAPETGALLAALTACVAGLGIEPRVVGKPSPILFRQACAAIGVDPAEAVMIGDNPDTDIRGAQALGLGAVLVTSGSGSGASFADLI
jgi:HAD superfamily hydrolase (TIGR01450 family)